MSVPSLSSALEFVCQHLYFVNQSNTRSVELVKNGYFLPSKCNQPRVHCSFAEDMYWTPKYRLTHWTSVIGNEYMNAPAKLETIRNQLQIFYCLRLTSWLSNHPESSPRAKNGSFFNYLNFQENRLNVLMPRNYCQLPEPRDSSVIVYQMPGVCRGWGLLAARIRRT